MRKKFFFCLLMGSCFIIFSECLCQETNQQGDAVELLTSREQVEDAMEADDADYSGSAMDDHYKQLFRDEAYKAGMACFKKGLYREALGKFQEALHWDKDYAPAIGYNELAEKKINQKTEREHEKVLVKKEKKVSKINLNLSRFYYQKGLYYFKKGKFKEALERFCLALEYDPEFRKALEYVTLSQFEVNFMLAKKEQGLQAQQFPNEKYIIDYILRRGRYFFSKGEYEDALALFQEALNLSEGDTAALKFARAAEDRIALQRSREKTVLAKKSEIEKRFLRRRYFSEGQDYFNQGRYKQALLKFKDALRYDPGHKPTLFYIELCEENLRRQEESGK